MAKKNAHSATKNVKMTESDQPKSSGEARGGEMENLREILFGNQARQTENRLSQLEDSLQALRGDFINSLDERAAALQDVASVAEKEITAKINNQANINQAKQQALEESISQLRADANKQLETLKNQYSRELENIRSSLSEQIRRLQSESRQRDDELRQELLTMSSWLENKLTPRHDLGQLLIDLGQHLQKEANGQVGSAQDEEHAQK